MQHKITIFKSINSHIPQYFDVEEVLSRIKRGGSKELIKNIRNEVNKDKRNSLKKGLAWICFSGEFRKRLNSELINHSGLICLDFDNFPDDKTMIYWRKEIKTRGLYCFSVFTSPSGNGLKALYKIPKCNSNTEHNNRFVSISEFWNDCEYFDKNVKGISRVCFDSYDENIYVNRSSTIYKSIYKQEEKVKNITSHRLVESQYDKIFIKLTTWFESKYNLVKGSRNANLFYFMSACRDYKIPQEEALSLITNYAQNKAEDFESISKELQVISKQAYAKVSAGKVMSVIPMTDKASEQDTTINTNGLFQYDDNFQSEEVLQKIEKDTKKKAVGEIPNETTFWTWGASSFKIDFLALRKFLQEQGFYRYEINDKDFIFIRVIENTIQELDVRHIKDFLLKCLESWDKTEIYNMIAENTKFRKEYLNYLDPISITWNKDTKEYGWVYFSNIAVKVSSKNIEIVNYIDLDGFIWKTQKLNREFVLIDSKDSLDSDFARFINNISNKDSDRFSSFRSAIGYLLHGHKSKSTVKAVILNDEIIADDAMGGTGKGLTMQILGTLKNIVIIPGADFNTGKDFAWQRINFDTDIVLIDDVEKNFKYKKLFTFLTDGWPIRKLYQDEIFLKPEDSPKMVINTNYILKGDTDSYTRRKFELELYPHYSNIYQPIDDFKREFITEWSKEEHNKCDNFILYCLRDFLKEGLKLPNYVNLKYKKLLLNTSEDFLAFAKDFLLDNMSFDKKDLFAYYMDVHGLKFSNFPSQKIFTRWMEYWGEYNNYEYKSRAGAGGLFFIYSEGKNKWEQPGTTSLIF